MVDSSDLRHPDTLTDEQMECLLSGYVYKEKALEYLRSGRKVGEVIRPDREIVSADRMEIECRIEIECGPWKTYNPNFCENCGRVTNHTADGRCGISPQDGCGKQTLNVTTLGVCRNCHDHTLQSLRDSKEWTCLKCGKTWEHHEFVDIWPSREARYEKHMGIKLERYRPDSRTLGEKYWSFMHEQAPKIMYDLISEGQTLDEVAKEFDLKPKDAKERIRQYADKNGLENPYPKRKSIPRENKPNGRSCLACGRPLFGRELKWCRNEDCEGYYALHPEKKPEYQEEQVRLRKIKSAQDRLDSLKEDAKKWDNDESMKSHFRKYISDAELDLGILNGTIEPFHEVCSKCGKDIETNLTKDSTGDWDFVAWICEACRGDFMTSPGDSDTLIFYDYFRNLLVQKQSEQYKKRLQETEESLRRFGITVTLEADDSE